MFGFCFMLGKRCHRHTICGNRSVSSASLLFVAILFVRATLKKNLPVTVHPLLYADCTFKTVASLQLPVGVTVEYNRLEF